MQKFGVIAAAGLLAGGVLASAANVHFVKGPTATDAGVTLTVEGKLAGLGEGDVTILVNAAGVAECECANPGGNVAPGQDTAVEASGSVTLPVAKNGNVSFAVSTAVPVVPNVPTCPNDKWTASVEDVTFSAGTITVVQGGQIVLIQPL